MTPEAFGAIGGAGWSYMHPAVACALALLAILVFLLPRQHLIPTLLASFFLLPSDQVLVLGPFHFQTMRVVILFGWLRLLGIKTSSHDKFFRHGMNGIDKALLLMSLIGAINYVLLWRDWAAVVNQLGQLYTNLGGYFLLRFLIRDEEDVWKGIRALAYVASAIGALMVVERVTHENPYAFLGGGGLALKVATLQNGNRFRCWGPFGHAILAGVFGATLVPLFLGYGWGGRSRKLAVIGVIAATAIVVTANSSTPVLAYIGGVGALCLWPMRKHMRAVRWGIVLSLLCLQLSMHNPIWHAIGRLDFLGGDAWGRQALVDNFFRRFGEWWLVGVRSTADWGESMWDLCNQYVAVGESRGLLPLLFFLAILVCSYRYVGIAVKASEGDRNRTWFLWSLGAALFSHTYAFFGVSYFDQTIFAWHFLLVAVSVMTAPFLRSTARWNKPADLGLRDRDWAAGSSESAVTIWFQPRTSVTNPQPVKAREGAVDHNDATVSIWFTPRASVTNLQAAGAKESIDCDE